MFSAVVTECGSKPPLSTVRAPSGDSPAGQGGSKIVAPLGPRYLAVMSALRHASFAPLAAPDTRLLILGSLPGARSLADRQYYAHPTNQFWRLVGEVLDRPLATLCYDDRLAALRDARIGLWDVIRTAQRRTSSDSDIREAEAHDLVALTATLPALRMVAFNGGTAAAIGRRQLPAPADVTLIDLPSSSAANTRGYAAKLERWLRLREGLAD